MPVRRGDTLTCIWVKSSFIHAFSVAKLAVLFELTYGLNKRPSHHVGRAARSGTGIVGHGIGVWFSVNDSLWLYAKLFGCHQLHRTPCALPHLSSGAVNGVGATIIC